MHRKSQPPRGYTSSRIDGVSSRPLIRGDLSPPRTGVELCRLYRPCSTRFKELLRNLSRQAHYHSEVASGGPLESMKASIRVSVQCCRQPRINPHDRISRRIGRDVVGGHKVICYGTITTGALANAN